ncbi:uncharacterized protein HKW66_Vig0085830 [Vigna angularis]|uniref:Uncharacterized protein n=1 Tax=Phaseolus angularis TaxID=3914 RepID=A0A8T0KGX0_PHAAN|nr:uncharacterized protein HKW66_Vig0085830 [Vigna angularis]
MPHWQHNANPEGLHTEERFDGIREHVDESRGQNHPRRQRPWHPRGLLFDGVANGGGEALWGLRELKACVREEKVARSFVVWMFDGVACDITILMVMVVEARDDDEWLLMVVWWRDEVARVWVLMVEVRDGGWRQLGFLRRRLHSDMVASRRGIALAVRH